MTERIPPLKLSDDIPAELQDALRALRHEHSDPARLARVADKLSAVMDAFRLRHLPCRSGYVSD
jgi:hypothetical protein